MCGSLRWAELLGSVPGDMTLLDNGQYMMWWIGGVGVDQIIVKQYKVGGTITTWIKNKVVANPPIKMVDMIMDKEGGGEVPNQ